MSPRFLNRLVCLIGVFLIILSIFGESASTRAATVVQNAGIASSGVSRAIRAAEQKVRYRWFWCRLAGGAVIVLTVIIDRQLKRQASLQ
jgi:hypothetical protein